jgi:hypothetical protein
MEASLRTSARLYCYQNKKKGSMMVTIQSCFQTIVVPVRYKKKALFRQILTWAIGIKNGCYISDIP